jgi:5-methyltetrahydropteroyltriglutamate--homocysteine methyltransferase
MLAGARFGPSPHLPEDVEGRTGGVKEFRHCFALGRETMIRGANRILTTHTGSLPRGERLTELYARRQEGLPIDADELANLTKDAVRVSVSKQADCGIDIGNDGEQTREAFFLYVTRRLTGFGDHWRRPARADVERYPGFKKMRAGQLSTKPAVNNHERVSKAIGEVKYIDSDLVQQECLHLRAVIAAMSMPFSDAFMTAPSPGILAKAFLNEYYDSEDAYLAALGKALQVEYETIVNFGFLLQIDSPDLALERHMTYAQQPLTTFLDFAERVVATINKALVNVPRERVRLHVCWGNYEGPHDCDVPLKDILPVLLKANVGALVLPFANPRHAHDYRYLKKFPLKDDQVLVAGVIDSLTNLVEHPEVIADRLERIANIVGDPRRVVAGTDCGFDSAAGAGRVAQDVVWAKLAALSEGARIASENLLASA